MPGSCHLTEALGLGRPQHERSSQLILPVRLQAAKIKTAKWPFLSLLVTCSLEPEIIPNLVTHAWDGCCLQAEASAGVTSQDTHV